MTEPTGGSRESRTVADLIRDFASDEWLVRSHAREELVARGPEAVQALAEALGDSDDRIRWEAAKTLSQMRDPASIPALVGALRDEDGGVRWVAADGLARIGRASVVPVLRALLQHADSPWFREGAHHVLKTHVTPDTSGVVHALEERFQDITVPTAANEALKKLE